MIGFGPKNGSKRPPPHFCQGGQKLQLWDYYNQNRSQFLLIKMSQKGHYPQGCQTRVQIIGLGPKNGDKRPHHNSAMGRPKLLQ